MHDIAFIRKNPEAFDEGMKKRGLAPQSPAILKLDEEKRAKQTEIQELQSKRNGFAKAIGQAKAKGEDASAIMAESKALNERLAALEVEMNEGGELEALLSSLPNIPADDVPVGTEDEANKELRSWGKKPEFAFKPKEHYELGETLGLMDFERAAKISGARFVALKGQLAQLERALANFFLDHNTREFGFTEMVPPLLVRDNAVYGTGQLPKFSDDLFSTNLIYEIPVTENQIRKNADGTITPIDPELIKDIEDSKGVRIKFVISGKTGLVKRIKAEERLWLIPTAEVSLTNLVSDEIVNEADLPMRMTALTPCFRSEAGSAGRDTKGMIRQHQFSKVEMVSITKPEDSEAEHERMTKCAESLLQKLGLVHRIILLSSEAGFSNKKTYDLEVWLPGQNAYREISSCSNCGDFQARRMKARFKGKDGKNQFVHTLNGSGLAIGRTIVAILENYQREDGSIAIPDVLQPYMNGAKEIKK